jgi:cyclic pyranopterin phosphate synthase
MLSHLDKKNRPQMVNVGGKNSTKRVARASAIIFLPPEVANLFNETDFKTKKGPVIDTAIIAGTMGAKKTSDLIPFCHQINLENCSIEVDWSGENTLEIICTAVTTGKTGVEMEALTGASISALTIYDMCKALSHHIKIQEIKLIAKSGGKSEFKGTDED